MGAEDQAEEREVLLSIFPDEITDISPTEFRISITLDLPPDDNETDLTPPVMLLTVRYPEAYPDAEPYLDLSAPPNAEVHPLFSVADDREHLLEALRPTIAENLGMAMVFTLVSALKDEAEALVASRRAEAERVREEAALAAEREENKKFHGTAVTPESFIAWRDKFFKEMEEIRQREEEEARLAEAKKRGSGATREVKLTGRQLWEGGLVGKIDEDDVEDGDDITEEVEKLKVEE